MNILELLFPRRCPFCRKLLKDSEEHLCEECRKALPWAGRGCRSHGSFYSVCVSPLRYEGKAREALLRFKFSGKRSYARCFGHLMADCLRTHPAGQADVITYVPLHFLRLRKRGYCQTKLLAEELSRELQIPSFRLLRKKRYTGVQSHLRGEAARKANVSGAFSVKRHAELEGKTVLLVDDVVTTGATLAECSRVLLMAGAERVVCATLCQAQKAGKNDDRRRKPSGRKGISGCDSEMMRVWSGPRSTWTVRGKGR